MGMLQNFAIVLPQEGGGGGCLHKREHCLGLGRTKDKVETSLF